MANPRVTVGYQNGTVTITNGDVNISETKTIEFDLSDDSATGAKVIGVEFSKVDEPVGRLAPAQVFDNPHDLIKDNITHKLFGKTQGNNNLKLKDTDKTGKNESDAVYKYAVWVEDAAGNYYKSDDPAIINKPVKG